MKNQYQIRQARLSEAQEMTRLSFRSKAHWGYPEEWIELWSDDLTVTSEMLEKYIAFVVECDGEIVGFWCRDSVQSEEVSHGLLFIEPNHMGKGCAKMLFDAVKEESLKRGIVSFAIEADPNAVPFYLKMGAMKVGEVDSKRIPGRKVPVLRFDLRK